MKVVEQITGLPVEFSPDGENFTFAIPIEKIDHDKRIIEGVATSEAEDTQGDVVDFEASKVAFQQWAGNIREMHQPKAVGKRVSQEFDNTNRLVKVRAYISRGAPETWEKIVDGTLQAFSIGGKAIDTFKEIIKTADGKDHPRRRVTKYGLSELSIVDNGSNPDTTFTLVKSDGAGGLVQTEVLEEEPISVVMNKGSEVLVVDPQAEADILEYLSQSGFEKIGQLAKVDVEEDNNEPPLLQTWLTKISCPSCSKVAWTPSLDAGGGQIVCGGCNTTYEVGFGKVDESLWKTGSEQLSSGAGKSTLKEVKGVTSDLHVVYTCPDCDYVSKPTTVKAGKQSPEKKCPKCKDVALVMKDVGAAGKEGQETGTIATSPEVLQTQLRGAAGEGDDLVKGEEESTDEPKPRGLSIRKLTLVAEGEVDGQLLKMYKQDNGRQARGGEFFVHNGTLRSADFTCHFTGTPVSQTQWTPIRGQLALMAKYGWDGGSLKGEGHASNPDFGPNQYDGLIAIISPDEFIKVEEEFVEGLDDEVKEAYDSAKESMTKRHGERWITTKEGKRVRVGGREEDQESGSMDYEQRPEQQSAGEEIPPEPPMDGGQEVAAESELESAGLDTEQAQEELTYFGQGEDAGSKKLAVYYVVGALASQGEEGQEAGFGGPILTHGNAEKALAEAQQRWPEGKWRVDTVFMEESQRSGGQAQEVAGNYA